MFLNALYCSNSSQNIPVWLMRQAGRYQPSYAELRKKYSFNDLCLIPELACQVTLLPIQEMNVDAAILFSDILFPLKACDLEVYFSQSNAPSVHTKDERLNTIEQRVGAVIESSTIQSRLVEECSSIYEAVRLVKKELPISKPLLGFAAAPWTLLTYILEGTSTSRALHSKLYMAGNATESAALLRMVEELTVQHLNHQIEAGVSAVQLFDSWAFELDSEDFQKYAVEPLTRIIERLRRLPSGEKCPVIYFTKGMAYRYSQLLATGIQCLSCDVSLCPSKIASLANTMGVAVQGNLDPALLCLPKDHPYLQKKIVNLLEKMSLFSNYIFNLGHGVPKEADYNTVRFVVETVKNWKK